MNYPFPDARVCDPTGSKEQGEGYVASPRGPAPRHGWEGEAPAEPVARPAWLGRSLALPF